MAAPAKRAAEAARDRGRVRRGRRVVAAAMPGCRARRVRTRVLPEFRIAAAKPVSPRAKLA